MRHPLRRAAVAAALLAATTTTLSPSAPAAAEQADPAGSAAREAGPRFVFEGSWTTGSIKNRPNGVTVAPNGSVFVGMESGRIQQFSYAGKRLRIIGAGVGILGGLTLDGDDELHVPDVRGTSGAATGDVHLLTRDGTPVGTYAPDVEEYPGFAPFDVDVEDDNFDKRWIVDRGNDLVWRFNPGTDKAFSFGGSRVENPTSVTLNQGRVVVTSTGTGEVVSFSRRESFVDSFGSTGSGPGQFSGGPRAITWTGKYLLVTDGSRRVQAFTRDGDLVATLRTRLDRNYDIAAGQDGRFVVSGLLADGKHGYARFRLT